MAIHLYIVGEPMNRQASSGPGRPGGPVRRQARRLRASRTWWPARPQARWLRVDRTWWPARPQARWLRVDRTWWPARGQARRLGRITVAAGAAILAASTGTAAAGTAVA